MHIAFFSDQHPGTLGGLQVSLALQRTFLERTGHTVTVCAPDARRVPSMRYSRDDGVLLRAAPGDLPEPWCVTVTDDGIPALAAAVTAMTQRVLEGQDLPASPEPTLLQSYRTQQILRLYDTVLARHAAYATPAAEGGEWDAA